MHLLLLLLQETFADISRGWINKKESGVSDMDMVPTINTHSTCTSVPSPWSVQCSSVQNKTKPKDQEQACPAPEVAHEF